jgi:uncharacterized protein
MSTKDVAFYSSQLKLSGKLYLPSSSTGRSPGIVCCTGYSGAVEGYTSDIAEELAANGYVALTFFYRGFGPSEGIKCRLIPKEQCEDIMNAITFMQTLSEVDPEMIGLYGTSFGGANVVYTAAHDERVKCVVSTVGIGDGERWLRGLRRSWEWAEFLQAIENDKTQRVLKGDSKRVSMLDIMLPDPVTKSIVGERADKLHQSWGCEGYPLETAEATINFKPEQFVHKIAPRPILFIHTGSDLLVPPSESLSMYNRAGEVKKLVNLEGFIHYDVYKFRNPAGFERVVAESLTWFKQHLPLQTSTKRS